MRKIKYIAGILIITFILVFTGEMYVWNLESFETEYISTTMYLPSQSEPEHMISDIELAAQQHQCNVFTVERKMETLFSEKITIYCMDSVEQYLKQMSSVQSGKYRSLFLGEISVEFLEFDEIDDINRTNTFYVLGTIDNAREFKRELVNVYGGSSPQEGYVYFDASQNAIIIWIIGMLFLGLMTLYETTLLKKEMVIRFVYGENLSSIITKRFLVDVIVYLGYFILAYGFLKYFLKLHVDYQIYITLACITIFFLLDAFIYMRLFFVDFKSSMGHINGEKRILNISYIFSSCTIIVSTLIISVCAAMAGEGIEYWLQKDFFELYRNWSYISLGPTNADIETAEKMSLALLNNKNKDGKVFVNVYLGDGGRTGQPCLLFNKSTISYLNNQINISEYDFQDEIYYIVPEKGKDTTVLDIIDMAEMYMGEYVEGEIITYNNDCKVIGINRQMDITSKQYKNPLIILDLRSDLSYFNAMYISQASMFNISNNEWNQLISSKNVDYNTSYSTNVYDNYENQLKEKQRMLLMGMTVLSILVIMEAIVIKTILRYECIINSIELVIKTTLGYSILEKYKKIIFNTSMAMLFSLIGILAVDGSMNWISIGYCLVGFVVIFITYILLMFYYIRFSERAKVQNMLKGSIF